MAEFAYNNSYQASIEMALFEALYGRKCRSPIHWSEVGERVVLGPDVLREAEEKVLLARQRLLTAQTRQKSYANKRRRDLEFAVVDRVFLKVSPMRGVKRFEVRGKLSPQYIGPYEYVHDPEHMLLFEPPKLQEDMTYEEFPVFIIAREVRKLRNCEIPYVKVQWSNHDDWEATSELEEAMRKRHPHLFEYLD
ncbi:uncharacterized protein LOC109712101 [Ananas comosus]|uniref:Uncharacterized protein LOC109712101 n=1 Tax=Ananas comosus TaxID=4615 RepID=A0A6P5FCU3_ANACO|nr:uncharacterized protein LOC109712101 [Ananas comosus]